MENLVVRGRMKGFVDHIKEAYRQGSNATYWDAYLVSRPWEIKYENIEAPIFVWHGESDTLVPIYPAKQLVTELPNCKSHFIDGAGHFLLESEQVGRDIVRAIKESSA